MKAGVVLLLALAGCDQSHHVDMVAADKGVYVLDRDRMEMRYCASVGFPSGVVPGAVIRDPRTVDCSPPAKLSGQNTKTE